MNPVDLAIVGYWAVDMVNKIVYPSIRVLLKEECPLLYTNYMKLLEDNKSNMLILQEDKQKTTLLPQKYLETDIYKASREIKKMQKLNINILTTWYDSILDKNILTSKNEM